MKKFECIFYDFDGVMTDNRALIGIDGKEYVFVNRSDGYAISKIKEMGIKQLIVSTESNSVVESRGRKLGIEVIHNISDKGKVIVNYCKENNIRIDNTAFIGNDLNDISAYNVVGFKGAPADAEQEILSLADWVSKCNGGYGVIRDFYRFIVS